MNAADGVPRIPFGYTHAGRVVFLSDADNIPDGQQIPFRDLKVVMSPEPFWHFCVVVRRFLLTRGQAVVADHSMGDDALKLQAHARRSAAQVWVRQSAEGRARPGGRFWLLSIPALAPPPWVSSIG